MGHYLKSTRFELSLFLHDEINFRRGKNLVPRTKFSLFKQLNCFNDEGFLKVMSLRFIAYNNNKNELFSLKSENFAEFILQQRILNSGSK